jgi:riboflavin biosynthesis pyrimidine reductase
VTGLAAAGGTVLAALWIYACAADIAQQFLKAGLFDEIRLSVLPVVLGGRQFSLERTQVVESDGITHLRYQILK